MKGKYSATDLGDQETVLSRLVYLTRQSPRNALLEVGKLRQLCRMRKEQFDAAVIALHERGLVKLHYHDAPATLRRTNPSAFNELVYRHLPENDNPQREPGIYYVGIHLA